MNVRNDRTLAPTLFFTKNLWFSPRVNPLILLTMAVIALLTAARDLTGHDVLIGMLVLGLTGYTVAAVQGWSGATAFFALLPMTRERLIHIIALSIIFYSVLVQTTLAAVMTRGLALPSFGAPQIEFSQLPSGEVASVVQGFVVDLEGNEVPVKQMMRPSVLFGILAPGGWPGFFGWQVLIPILFAAASIGFLFDRNIRPMLPNGRGSHVGSIGRVLLYGTLGSLVLADYLLPSYTIWRWRTWLDHYPILLPSIVVLAITPFVASIVHQINRIRHIGEDKS